ncbi:lectin subunit alpha-like [Neocloeon triangulifer]|uniref:lectin subunit alpha-like n=1 Tax=Neocloeon triangulifer TaxID=2078957 RepID=UPI00286F3DDA|nr:lectin subunit alpha-like [Neocloeon triangulifer]
MYSIVKFAFLFVAVQSVVSIPANEDEKTLDLRFEYGNATYLISSMRLDWYHARNYCKVQGMDLVSIESVGENSAVMNAVSDMLTESFWISGSDLYQEGAFYWDSTGRAIGPFQNWAPNEPSGDRNEHCVELNINVNHLWNDVNCDLEKLFICEMNPCV